MAYVLFMCAITTFHFFPAVPFASVLQIEQGDIP
jgi:hypothetical protein